MGSTTVIRRLAAATGLALFVGSVCVAGAGSSGAVANGTPAKDGAYRFAVKLTMTGIPTADGGRRNSACSGALVAPQWVVTAGHCFKDKAGKRVDRPVADRTTATIGRTDVRDAGGHVVRVVAVRQASGVDLALAKLATPVRDVPPIKLSIRVPRTGDVVRLAGYGSVTGVRPKPVNLLRTGTFTVKNVRSRTVGVTGRTPKRTTSACAYDSGAPYFSETARGPRLVSIENTGPRCPHAKVETTARIDVLVEWIRKTTG